MKALKRIAAIVCVLMMVTASASAEYNLEQQYDEDFEYSGEYLAMALNTATVLVYYQATAQLTYKQVVYDRSSFVAAYNSEAKAYFDTGVTEDEYYAHMAEFTVEHIEEYLAYGSEQALEAGIVATGSGIVISEDGYIATNHHVVEVDDIERIEYYLSQNVTAVQEDYAAILQEITGMFGADDIGEVLSDEQQEDIYNTLINSYAESSVIRNEEIELFVLFPGTNGESSIDESRTYSAEIVKIGGESGTVEDVAIIRINAGNMVALELAEDYPDVASSVWTAGFPGIGNVNGDLTLTATITSGVVSAIKEAENSNYKYVQLDATFASGNSGGPSVNNKLKILGLNTLTSTNSLGSSAYYDVPFAAVRDTAAGLDIGMGDASKTFLLGIQALQQGYGKTALECFQAVKTARADTPYIDTYIEKAQKAEQTQMPRGFKLNIDSRMIGMIVVIVVVVVIIAVIILLLTRKKKPPVTPTDGGGLGINWGGDGGSFGDTEILSDYGSTYSNNEGGDLL